MPPMVGVASLVLLSPTVPLSLASSSAAEMTVALRPAVLGSLSPATLPAASVASTDTLPSGTLAVGVMRQLPFASTVAEPMAAPFASLATTTAPGSPVPMMGSRVPAVPASVKLTLVLVSTVKGVPLTVLGLPEVGVTVMTGV